MILSYQDYEQNVYHGLEAYRQQHPDFTFSVRQNGSKGAELDYFIGTAKSKYFAFTCWLIPLSFPGSSSDLVDFFFNYGEGGRLAYYMQASAPKKATDEQLAGCAAFVYKLRKLAGEGDLPVGPDPEDKRHIDFYLVPEPRLFDSFEELWATFVPFLDRARELVERAIDQTKAELPKWQAGRFTETKFKELIKRMDNRFQRYGYLDHTSVTPAVTENPVKAFRDEQLRTQPLNQILYGPPGTGKTYHTINKAVEIIDPVFYTANLHNRKALLKRFNDLVIRDWADPNGQIAFTTFHQSMSYEDFIEGIKPVVDEENLGAAQAPIRYEIKDGIFKLMAQKATWKKGNFSQVLESFKKDINELEKKPSVTIKAAYTSFEVTYRGTGVFYVSPLNSSKIEKPWYPVNIENIRKAYETDDYKGIYNPTYVREILNYLFGKKGLVPAAKSQEEARPHVLIIDEINRGNIAQIFGELITLIETEKRAGEDERLEVMLTYSKQPFSVPNNLYIIGTMNTADRSVEALDTALRRRFTFHEMMPEPMLLSPHALLAKFAEKYDAVEWEDWIENYSEQVKDFYAFVGLPDWEIGAEEERALYDLILENRFDAEQAPAYLRTYELDPPINLSELLQVINDRIEILYDREHTIGHSFFFKLVGRNHPVTALRQIFKDELIPLLQEYFFNDYTKIGLVLGQTFVSAKHGQKVKPSFFAEFSGTAAEDYVRPVYQINTEVLADNGLFTKALLKLLRKPVIATQENA